MGKSNVLASSNSCRVTSRLSMTLELPTEVEEMSLGLIRYKYTSSGIVTILVHMLYKMKQKRVSSNQ